MYKVAITGHRPDRIKGKEKEIRAWVIEQIKNLQGCYDNVMLIDGMARGTDQIAALGALTCGVQLSLYFAYKHKLNEVEEYLADSATEFRFLSDRYYDGCFVERDRRMVDDCDMLLVVWDGKPYGGTYQTYQYALMKGKEVLLLPWGI